MDERWPRLLGPPLASGRLRAQAEDFRVEEIPAYAPCGHGEHLMIEIEKTGLTTDQVVRTLARHLGIKASAIGAAGLKDRKAVTRQWLSVPAAARAGLDSFDHSEISILRAELHTNKLKTGHLEGNRFRIRLRAVEADQRKEIERRCRELGRLGVPNYFGPQRFGREGANEAEGRALLAGRGQRHDRRGLRFMLNAAQSGLFNDVLALRIREGLFSAVLEGDVLIKADTGGRFVCTDPDADQPRADRFEVHASGPMFGPKMTAPAGRPAEMERQMLSASGLQETDFRRFAKLTRGTRRPLRMALTDLQLRFEGDELELAFSLPAGGYATALLRELVEPEELSSGHREKRKMEAD